MSVYRSYLSVVTRSSGYAIAILVPKGEGYAVLGSSQLDGADDHLHLRCDIIGRADAAVNHPRVRQLLAPVGPHCLLCNEATEIAVINQMFKQTGGLAAVASQPYAVTAEQTHQTVQGLRHHLANQQLVATDALMDRRKRALDTLGQSTPGFTFDDVPLSLAAIAQVSAYEQAGPSTLLPVPAAVPTRLQPVVEVPQGVTQGWMQRLRRWFS